jgi:putative endonuclease
MTYYIYILHSINHDKFYIGYTTDVNKRLKLHNSSRFNTFTSKYRPWIIYALFEVGENKTTALKIEKYIKKQKSRTLLIKLGDINFIPNGKLNQLVRVPHVRD